jgi:peroxiredoxin
MSHSFSRALAPLAIALGLALGGCGGGASTGARSATTASAPDFSLPTIDGKTVRLSSYLDGKHVVLLDFWSTTCDPCMVEMPHLVELYKAKKDQGFVVLAISLDGPESRAQVSSTVHDKDMIFPVLLDEETTVVARYNPKREMPFSVLIGKDGSILQKRGGYTPGDEKLLNAEVDKALAAP